jgi:hypothetical protein
MIIKRWQEWAGAMAVLEGDGRSFGALAGQRRGA